MLRGLTPPAQKLLGLDESQSQGNLLRLGFTREDQAMQGLNPTLRIILAFHFGPMNQTPHLLQYEWSVHEEKSLLRHRGFIALGAGAIGTRKIKSPKQPG